MGKQLNKQQGVFIIEFAIVASAIALFLVFISDVVIKQNTHGHLQRLSYSGVSIIKERTRLYRDSDTDEVIDEINREQGQELFDLMKGSIERTSGLDPDFLAMHLEQVVFSDDGIDQQPTFNYSNTVACIPDDSLASMDELFFTSSRGNAISLYRVTLCYEGDNWFGNLVDTHFTTVSASSIMIGR